MQGVSYALSLSPSSSLESGSSGTGPGRGRVVSCDCLSTSGSWLCYVAVCTSWGHLHPCSLSLPVSPFHPNPFFRWGHTGDGLLPIQCLLLGCHLQTQVEIGDALQVLGLSYLPAQAGLCQHPLHSLLCSDVCACWAAHSRLSKGLPGQRRPGPPSS